MGYARQQRRKQQYILDSRTYSPDTGEPVGLKHAESYWFYHRLDKKYGTLQTTIPYRVVLQERESGCLQARYLNFTPAQIEYKALRWAVEVVYPGCRIFECKPVGGRWKKRYPHQTQATFRSSSNYPQANFDTFL